MKISQGAAPVFLKEVLNQMSVKKNSTEPKTAKPKTQRTSRPAFDPEAREHQLVNLAVQLAEKQLKDGTASAAVITHYLKLASKRETLERDILEKQKKLIEAKAESITKGKESEELAQKAIEAMKNYNSGS